jgi:hypothetical protein
MAKHIDQCLMGAGEFSGAQVHHIHPVGLYWIGP